MTQHLQSPRNLSPMWLDLAHVVAGQPAQGATHPRERRCAPRPVARRQAETMASGAAARRLSLPVLFVAQIGGAVLTAGLLKLMGLSPV